MLPQLPWIGRVHRNGHQSSPQACHKGHNKVNRGRIHKKHAVAGRQGRSALGPHQKGMAQRLCSLVQLPVGDGFGSFAARVVKVGPQSLFCWGALGMRERSFNKGPF